MNPGPLGDLILDLLFQRLSEEAHVDYKLTINLSRTSRFPEIAKDIFALANRGGGWIMIGFLDTKGVIRPVGVPSDYQFDQATLQQKFNSYSSEPIELEYRTFSRTIEEEGKMSNRPFSAIYVPPSTSILTPTKDGKYPNPKTGRPKTVFKVGQIFTRRGTQSVEASNREVLEIKKRIMNELHRQSVLSGKPDEVDETIFGNLLRVIETPDYVFEAISKEENIPLSRTGRKPFRVMGRRILSFCDLQKAPFKKFIEVGSQKQTKFADAITDEDSAREIMNLLNNEAIAALRTRRLIYDYQSHRMYYPEKNPPRYESWEGLTREFPRQVVWKQRSASGRITRFVHASVSLRFKRIGSHIFLRLEPGYLITSNGETPIHDFKEGLLIGSLLRQRWNNQYYADLRFWLHKMPRTDEGNIAFGSRIVIEPHYIRSYMHIGIDGDTPSSEQKAGPTRKINSNNPTVFKAIHVKEPKLVFGKKKEDEDPRIGLRYFGPFHAADEEPVKQMRVGIVGTGRTRAIAKDILEMLGKEQKASDYGKLNRFLFADFPGFNSTTSVSCDIIDSDSWGSTITKHEVDTAIEKENPNERIGEAANLLHDKVKSIAMEDNRPDVIFCVLPKKINDECGIGERTRGAKTRRASKSEVALAQLKEEGQTFLTDFDIIEGVEKKPSKSFDLRDALKGKILNYGIPIQVLLQHKAEALLKYSSTTTSIQNPATFCWNLSTAMYYKANGKPWRLAKLEEGTCYVGIAFYRSRLDVLNQLHVSMAQVFTHSGDGFVLRGSEVLVDEKTKQPYLAEEKANELLQDAIKMYSLKAGTAPSRVVVHKTSLFTTEEREGILNAIGKAKADLVTIRYSRDIRFVRTGKYPILRGTLITLSNDEFLLYTNGYIPRLRTYPGQRIPVPLYLKMDCDSEPEVVAEEILKLTKINWNTTKFAESAPITIVFPRSVGKVLAELPEGAPIQSHYRFYM